MSLTGSALTLAVCELQNLIRSACSGTRTRKNTYIIHWSHGRGYGAFHYQRQNKVAIITVCTGFREGMRESEAGRGEPAGAFG